VRWRRDRVPPAPKHQHQWLTVGADRHQMYTVSMWGERSKLPTRFLTNVAQRCDTCGVVRSYEIDGMFTLAQLQAASPLSRKDTQ
jgi:hypothetical protein